MKNFIPESFEYPYSIPVLSAWEPLAPVIKPILTQFGIKRNTAIEFGVERGFSTSVLANYFDKVVGIDRFDWIIKDGINRSITEVEKLLINFKNINLIESSFEDWIKRDHDYYDLVHVDIGYDSHTYEPTYQCGEWAVNHSDCVLFHDTISFPEVDQACRDLSELYQFEYYNYKEPIGPAGRVCGLGILIRKL